MIARDFEVIRDVDKSRGPQYMVLRRISWVSSRRVALTNLKDTQCNPPNNTVSINNIIRYNLPLLGELRLE